MLEAEQSQGRAAGDRGPAFDVADVDRLRRVGSLVRGVQTGMPPLDGRVLLMLSNNNTEEPRFQITNDADTQLVFGIDVEGLKPGEHAIFDQSVLGYPIKSLADLPALLGERAGYYDVIWVARTHNLRKLWPMLDEAASGARIVLDTEAVASIREAEQAVLDGRTFDLEEALGKEFAGVPLEQALVAVNRREADVLRKLGFEDVSVIGHMRAARPTTRPFWDRSGLLFVGAMHEAGSPNYDGLLWFVQAVLPLVERELGWETVLTVAGFQGEGVDL